MITTEYFKKKLKETEDFYKEHVNKALTVVLHNQLNTCDFQKYNDAILDVYPFLITIDGYDIHGDLTKAFDSSIEPSNKQLWIRYALTILKDHGWIAEGDYSNMCIHINMAESLGTYKLHIT